MRPLGLEFQDDPGSLASDYQFMLGPYLMVAPVLNPEGRVDVYLPPGVWYDLWTGEKATGPAVHKRKVALDVLPLYIRSSAILPMVEAGETVADLWDPLTVEVYPDANGALHLPEEDGRPDTRAEVMAGRLTRLMASGPARSWRLLFKDVDEPRWVRFVKGRGVHRYNGASRTLEVQAPGCAELEIEIER
jgi:alpha-D-xyloside xylohydrolase